ncbi:MAG: 3-phosphoshikimate 1-carboxyvinyltransferase [Actinomycetota bacterium]|nr:3-phosphoshikimate 1-carboxyvinyltransferase [Actinomycetota bacterium]
MRRVEPVAALTGVVRVPGDKSASHRALMLSALAAGESTIEGLSPGLDVAATSQIMIQLGAQREDVAGVVHVSGPASGLRASESSLQCGNSGTTMRLVSGIVSSIEGEHRLEGDDSLSRRPMDRIAVPLDLMGSRVTGEGVRVTPPLTIHGSRNLRGIDYRVPTPSAQVKSAILLAGLAAQGDTIVHEALRTRTNTEDMLRLAGVQVTSTNVHAGRHVVISPGRPLARAWRVPTDPSQAAFFCVLGLIHDQADVEVIDVDDAPERTGFLSVLSRMGADLTLTPGTSGVTIRARSSQLRATEIHASQIPSVDEAPVLTVAAAAASGVSAFRDMGELRLKESDRFEGSMTLARLLGCRVWSEGDDYFVEGVGGASAFNPFVINAGLDHRIVMSSAVAGLAGRGCDIDGADTVSSSYPGFFEDLASLRR